MKIPEILGELSMQKQCTRFFFFSLPAMHKSLGTRPTNSQTQYESSYVSVLNYYLLPSRKAKMNHIVYALSIPETQQPAHIPQ